MGSRWFHRGDLTPLGGWGVQVHGAGSLALGECTRGKIALCSGVMAKCPRVTKVVQWTCACVHQIFCMDANPCVHSCVHLLLFSEHWCNQLHFTKLQTHSKTSNKKSKNSEAILLHHVHETQVGRSIGSWPQEDQRQCGRVHFLQNWLENSSQHWRSGGKERVLD